MIDVYKLTKWEEIYVDNFVQSIICNTQKQALIGKSKFRNQHSRKRDVLIYVLWYFVFFLQFTRFKSYFWVQYRILIELYKLPPLSQLVWFNEMIFHEETEFCSFFIPWRTAIWTLQVWFKCFKIKL